MKICPVCRIKKPRDDFHKCAAKPDGLQRMCKLCQKIDAASRYLSDPNKNLIRTAKWRASNTESNRANKADWHKKNREKALARISTWRAANPEKIIINKNNRRARKLHAGGKLSQGLAKKLYVLQRGKCACGCKQPLGDKYHLDHRMPLALGGANEDWNIQLLRQTCNLQKHAKHPVDFMQQKGFLI